MAINMAKFKSRSAQNLRQQMATRQRQLEESALDQILNRIEEAAAHDNNTYSCEYTAPETQIPRATIDALLELRYTIREVRRGTSTDILLTLIIQWER